MISPARGALLLLGVLLVAGAAHAQAGSLPVRVDTLSVEPTERLVCLQDRAPTEQARSFAVVGILGSFTTFSTFSLETVELLRAGDITRAVTYAAGSTALGVIAVVVGISIATVLLSSRA